MGRFYLHISNRMSSFGIAVCGVGLGETQGPGEAFYFTQLNEFPTLFFPSGQFMH